MNLKKITTIVPAFLFILLILISRAPGQEDASANVIVILENERLSAFSSRDNDWVSVKLSGVERVFRKIAKGNVAVVTTSERVLAFSALTGSWSEVDLDLDELIRSIQVEDHVATVKTDSRALGFNVRSGKWVESR